MVRRSDKANPTHCRDNVFRALPSVLFLLCLASFAFFVANQEIRCCALSDGSLTWTRLLKVRTGRNRVGGVGTDVGHRKADAAPAEQVVPRRLSLAVFRTGRSPAMYLFQRRAGRLSIPAQET